MRVETKKVYYADDGTLFESKELCEQYEKDIEEKAAQTTYWAVRYHADTTEGRGHNGLTYIEAYISTKFPSPRIWMEDWCIRQFGKKIDFVMGVSPIESWILTQIDRTAYLAASDGWIGSTKISGQRTKLVVGFGDLGLVIAQNL